MVEIESSQNTSAIQSPMDVLMLLLILLIIVVFIVVMAALINFWTKGMSAGGKKERPQAAEKLSPTQLFILAASSASIGREYKCVIDIWDTHLSQTGRTRAKDLFQWSWGAPTCENAKETANDFMNRGLLPRYRAYCGLDVEDGVQQMEFTSLEKQIFEEIKQKYPDKGVLAWDLLRVLSVVGGAYMVGIMEYDEAARIALEACRKLQENFSSWDDMAENYTLGYQLWRGKRKKDRLNYYKSLKKGWVYEIDWNTELKEEEL